MSSTQERIDRMFRWREQCVLRCNDVDKLIEQHGYEAFPPEFHATHAQLRATLEQYNQQAADWITEAQGELSGIRVIKNEQEKRRISKTEIALGLILGIVLIVVLL